jgi:predicted CXXCH cytochrome family protein
MRPSGLLLALPMALAALVAACEGCKPSGTAKPAASAAVAPVTGRLVLMSDLGAALEPCGCVADQRGGLARLGAFMEGAGFPVALAAAGPTFFDDVLFEDGRLAQALDKARTVASIFATSPFFFAPSRSDFAAGRGELAALLASSKGYAVSAGLEVGGAPFGAPRLVEVGPTKVAFVGFSAAPKDALVQPVEGVRFEAGERSLREEVAGLRAQGARLVVLLASASRGEALRVVDHTPGIDVVLVGAASVRGEVVREDVPIDRVEGAVVLEPASRLQSVAVVDLVDRGGAFAEGPSGEGSRFTARLEQVGAARVKSATFAALIADYDARVDAQNRVRYASREPMPVAEGQARYVGAQVCAGCHAQPTAVWSATRHAHAYPSLTEKHKAFDLDCVGCHVTGYEKPGGSTVTHVTNLENVQCEVCHGPGSSQVAGGGLKSAIVRKPEPSLCVGCHHEPHVQRGWRVEDAWPKVLGPGHGAPKG